MANKKANRGLRTAVLALVMAIVAVEGFLVASAVAEAPSATFMAAAGQALHRQFNFFAH